MGELTNGCVVGDDAGLMPHQEVGRSLCFAILLTRGSGGVKLHGRLWVIRLGDAIYSMTDERGISIIYWATCLRMFRVLSAYN